MAGVCGGEGLPSLPPPDGDGCSDGEGPSSLSLESSPLTSDSGEPPLLSLDSSSLPGIEFGSVYPLPTDEVEGIDSEGVAGSEAVGGNRLTARGSEGLSDMRS